MVLQCGHEHYVECRGCRRLFCVPCFQQDVGEAATANLHLSLCEANFPGGPKQVGR